MVPRPLAAGAALLVCAVAPGRFAFAAGVLAMQLASSFVLYATALVAMVQLGGRGAQRSITHLTLIAGFASTLFWPRTTTLNAHLGWREIHAGLNLLVGLPLQSWLARVPAHIHAHVNDPEIAEASVEVPHVSSVRWSPIFLLMLAGFAVDVSCSR